jgi:hypothetical protein
MATVNDPRIGVRDLSGRVTKKPTKYINGAPYSAAENQVPTTSYFEPTGRYFYVMPIGATQITAELRDELMALVGDPIPASTTATASVSAVIGEGNVPLEVSINGTPTEVTSVNTTTGAIVIGKKKIVKE